MKNDTNDTNDTNQEIKAEPIVIRLLNGHLAGCEFILMNGTTFFVVADEETIRQQAMKKSHQENTLFVPIDSGGVNFEIRLNDSKANPYQATLKVAGQPIGVHSVLAHNKIIYVGALALAIRSQNSAWHDDVINFPWEGKKNKLSMFFDKASNKKKNYGMVTVVAATLILVVCTVTYKYFSDESRQTIKISAMLGQRKNNYTYIPGKDKTTYVFAYNNEDRHWAQQAFIRTDTSSVVKVTDLVSEEERLRNRLRTIIPKTKLLRIKLTQPQQLDLVLSKERGELSAQQQKSLTKDLITVFPYIERVDFSTLSDRYVMNEAEQGVKKIAVPYTKIVHQESITFLIQGDIDDNQLERVKSFVHDFEQRWSESYIQFVIELKKDWLVDKSYKYGAGGYVKMSSSHWYFPKNIINQ